MVSSRSQIIGLEEIPSSILRESLDVWETWRGGNTMPAWSDVSLVELPPKALPSCLVVDVERQPKNYTYRFWGTHATDWHGRDMTLETVNDLIPDLFRALTVKSYDTVCATKSPLVQVDEFLTERDIVGQQVVLRLPISEDVPDRVDKILTVIAMSIFDKDVDAAFYETVWAD